jgi:hypothetical protein
MHPMTRKYVARYAGRSWAAIPADGGTTTHVPSAMNHTNRGWALIALLALVPLSNSAQGRPQTGDQWQRGTLGHTSVPADTQVQGGRSGTPESMGLSPADIDLTRQIRRAVLADESLSTYAHNVRIIVRDGLVTLRGPVRSEHEKAVLEEKAALIVGSTNVRNEVEVSPARDR